MGDKFAAALAGDDDEQKMITAADVYGRGGALLPRRDVIKREADGTMTYKRAVMTSVGLVMPDDVTEEELIEIGTLLRGMESSIQWLLGDWLNRAERMWGQIYTDVPEYSYQTLRDYAYVARNVELSIRNRQLSFMHHRLVAALSPDDQAVMLKYAAENKLTVAQLRAAIKQAMQGEQPAEDLYRGVHEIAKQAVKWGGQIAKQAQNIEQLKGRERQQLRDKAQWLSEYYRKIAERAK